MVVKINVVQIWDVLSNKEVVKIVSSGSDPSKAARQVIDRAVRAWRRKYPTSMVDDCAVVCLFLNRPPASRPNEEAPHDHQAVSSAFTGSFRKVVSGVEGSEEGTTTVWRALEGVARANSVMRLPRMGRVLSWRRRSSTSLMAMGEDQDH